MLLKNILNNVVDSIIYLERYVNSGSPSGFTYKYTTSKDYDPLEGLDCFKLPLFRVDEDKVDTFGQVPQKCRSLFFDGEGKISFPLHPDCYEKHKSKFEEKITFSPFWVCPTASARTVIFTHGNELHYFKLHYDGILCRAKRQLPKRKAIAGVEISELLKDHIDSGFFDKSFAIFLEQFAFNISMVDLDFGFVYRIGMPYPFSDKLYPLIPFFSLTSPDKKHPKDDVLLLQLLSNFDQKLDVFFTKLIFPIIAFYVKMIKDMGLIPELNAQNILLELNDDGDIRRIVIRDHMGTDKDITLRKKLGLDVDFAAIDYKVIDEELNSKLYYIRRSFHYDFKLCKYVIEPLLELYSKEYNHKLSDLKNIVKDIFISEIGDLRYEYFHPYNEWYSHPKILFEGEREYITNYQPEYR